MRLRQRLTSGLRFTAATCAAILLISSLGCAPLLRTNFMLKDYVGKPVDSFMQERAFAAFRTSPTSDGGAVYEFHGGPGGEHCVFYVVTDPARIIKSYRFENC